MIISGRNPVLEAFKNKKARKLFVRKGANIHFDDITIPFEVLEKRPFENKFGLETQGVAADVPDFEYTDFKEFLYSLKDEKGVVILDKIQDPHNFGAIIRAAHCFGVNHFIVARYEQAKTTPAVYKASAGAIFYANIAEVVNIGNAIDILKNNNFIICATDMNGDTPLNKFTPLKDKKTAVIIGSEGKGIRESLIDRADYKLSIPMNAKIDSLNASMSAAIAFYQIYNTSC